MGVPNYGRWDRQFITCSLPEMYLHFFFALNNWGVYKQCQRLQDFCLALLFNGSAYTMKHPLGQKAESRDERVSFRSLCLGV